LSKRQNLPSLIAQKLLRAPLPFAALFQLDFFQFLDLLFETSSFCLIGFFGASVTAIFLFAIERRIDFSAN
jgi:hypothetical protein